MMINYESTPEFNKDLQALCKKYRTLKEDIEVLKKAAIELYHENGINNEALFPIPRFCTESIISYKVKKFASRSFKGKGVKTGLRLIYIYKKDEKEVLFVEIYYKGVKKNEDRERLGEYFRDFSS